ncbi:unnamed protein product [Rotaria socialis]|uniref:Uncharacterized protein n=3 Tax=Rotaria socialis TaxID=392032 RepID=A0A819AL67_9BILA|nr:unnamed protein product [Rotaria socialis]CAF3450688.1 unnamed protein product [Rotaria socialis]CAF3532242.1 unnamed protein product [Rotaria socialis]CAF3787369.1 unnamed protein product [Rotaria socialis]CAF4491896.1 unnamed protein product [Rotaria socialis]
MDHNKKSSTTEKHGTTAGASSKPEKNNQKKDENVFSKAVHQIEEKVHDLTDGVKEKAHHLTHMDDAQKDKNTKKTKDTMKPSSKPSNVAKKVSSDGKDENLSKPPAPPSSPAEPQSGHEVNDANPEHSSKPASNEAQSAKSVDPPMSSESKQTTNKPNSVPSNAMESNPSPTEDNSNNKVHISFNGVETVDDLLERIDEAVENAKVVVDTRKNKSASNGKKEETSNTNDIEKKTEVETEKEPIHITYNDVHQLKDLLALVNNQPGHRKVVLEGVPKKTNVITLTKTDNSSTAKFPETTKNEPEDVSTKEKSVENGSCSVDKSSSKSDLIHINIENIENVNDLLNRIDDAVENIRVVIDTESPTDKTPDVSKSNDKSQSERNADKKGTIYKKEIAAAMKFQKPNLEIEPVDNQEIKKTF